ncbi:sulfoxide reductase heme-binding subunit YedZ [Babesia caballi]|uniref:Sulfoxide reductase heme-binding subunit YedZ n=1 Tax=Babesia caballi TaxID=5871 RepID=A0AAV4LVA8_BABCB|nr:sulfoxide reductase heme-binding subunit YedZ [Babesia caballi]
MSLTKQSVLLHEGHRVHDDDRLGRRPDDVAGGHRGGLPLDLDLLALRLGLALQLVVNGDALQKVLAAAALANVLDVDVDALEQLLAAHDLLDDHAQRPRRHVVHHARLAVVVRVGHALVHGRVADDVHVVAHAELLEVASHGRHSAAAERLGELVAGARAFTVRVRHFEIRLFCGTCALAALALLLLLLSHVVKGLDESGDVAILVAVLPLLVAGLREVDTRGGELLEDRRQGDLALLGYAGNHVGVGVRGSLDLGVVEDDGVAVVLDHLHFLDAGDAGSADGPEPELEALVVSDQLVGLLYLPPGRALAAGLCAGNTHAGAKAFARRQHIGRHILSDCSRHLRCLRFSVQRIDGSLRDLSRRSKLVRTDLP